jgi:hypothetical protein
VETDGPTDDPLDARIDFSPGGDVNGRDQEKIRACVLDGIGNPDDVCSAYGVSTVTPPPFFFTNTVTFTDSSGVDNESFPVYIHVNGELADSNNSYSITITGDP